MKQGKAAAVAIWSTNSTRNLNKNPVISEASQEREMKTERTETRKYCFQATLLQIRIQHVMNIGNSLAKHLVQKVNKQCKNLIWKDQIPKNLNDVKVKAQYQVKTSNKYAPLEIVGDNVDIYRARENIKYQRYIKTKDKHELQQHKPRFDTVHTNTNEIMRLVTELLKPRR